MLTYNNEINNEMENIRSTDSNKKCFVIACDKIVLEVTSAFSWCLF